MQPGASPQGRETGSGSSSRRARAAWFLPPHPAKAVSALNRCSEMGEQLFGLQPQDRQHDSSEQEHGECTMFLSVCLKGGKATVEPLPVTDQRSDFSLCPVSEGQPHKHTLTRTHTHTQSDEQGMQLLESLPVRAFCLSPNELQCAMFVYLRACERACDRKTAGGSRAVTSDMPKEPGHINQKNRCLHAVTPV